MTKSSTSHSRRGTLAAAAVTVVLGFGGTAAVFAGLHGSSGAPEPVRVSAPQPAAPPAPSTGSSNAADALALHVKTLPRSRPVGLTIPSIGVHASTVVKLGKDPNGNLQVPTDFATPGWFADGPAPGQFGPAVIAGHVDSTNGPAVFYRLGALRRGAAVMVSRADGSTVRFSVDKVERYAKNRFPTVAVYGDATHRSELRLITCAGTFDRSTGHYLDNVVAYAHLV